MKNEALIVFAILLCPLRIVCGSPFLDAYDAALEADGQENEMDLWVAAIKSWTPEDGEHRLAFAETNAGSIQLHHNNPAAALEFLKAAVKLEPKNHTSLHQMAIALSGLHRYAASIRANQTALQHLDGSVKATVPILEDLCAASGNLERYDEALEYCRKAMVFEPHPEDSGKYLIRLYAKRGHLYAAMGKTDLALKDLEWALASLKSKNAEAALYAAVGNAKHSYISVLYDGLGFAHFKKGDRAKALDYFRQAIEASPNYADSYLHRGLLYAVEKNATEARKDIDSSLRLDPEYVEAYVASGDLRRAAGDAAGAKRDYNAACKREFPPACAKLK